MNIKNIINSWVKTAYHNDDELLEATKRISICKKCPLYVDGIGDIKICNDCGCPLSYNDTPIGKAFSKEEGCPKDLW